MFGRGIVRNTTGTSVALFSSGDANTAMIASLSGGDSAVGAFYCLDNGAGALHSSVSHSGGFVTSITDYRGASGYGPTLDQLGASGGMAINTTDRLLTNDGTAARSIGSTVNALFTLSGNARALIVVGHGESGAATSSYLAGVSESGATRSMLIRSSGSTLFYEAYFNATVVSTDVSSAATPRRLVIAHKSSGASATCRVAARTPATNGAANLPSAGTCALTIGDFYTGATQYLKGSVRAVLYLLREPTADDLTKLGTWASTYHGVTLAA